MTATLPTADLAIRLELTIHGYSTPVEVEFGPVPLILDDAVACLKTLIADAELTVGQYVEVSQPIYDLDDVDTAPPEPAPAPKTRRATTKAKPTGATSCDVPGCEKAFNGPHGLQVHKARSHKGEAAVTAPPTSIEPETDVLALRCHHEDCDAVFKLHEAAKVRSHARTAHNRDATRDELTPLREVTEGGVVRA
ncbi:MAG: hypothetical protein Q8K63_15880 [Acidimicrobiales bacterium]|nr:hypothetical protein [Acidimicrobiales bacterium]